MVTDNMAEACCVLQKYVHIHICHMVLVFGIATTFCFIMYVEQFAVHARNAQQSIVHTRAAARTMRVYYAIHQCT
jgi:hypothetical protein